jgi:steroid delta-isomerase-like uncharacterized protein
MSTEENEAIYRRFITEVANRGNMAAADELLAPAVVEHETLPPGLTPDRDGIKKLFGLLRAAFPDLQITIEDLITDADKVVARVTLSGTHRGALLGIPPTGRAVSYQAIDISRMAGGQLVEHWGVPDYLSLLQQLGALPAPSGD